MTAFEEFPKIPRLSREVIITEKIDGTNAQVYITPIEKDYSDDRMLTYFYGPDASTWAIYAGSRTRWVVPGDDNHGFAGWVLEHEKELRGLGPGRHFGEWWGRGINRGYSRPGKHFSLFNVTRWGGDHTILRPACCDVVPVLYSGPLEEYGVMKGLKEALKTLRENGSVAAPGFMQPEGVVIYHVQSNRLFKKTLEKDEEWKGKQA